MATLYPSGDTTGVTDQANVAAAITSNDLVLAAGNWYFKADTNGACFYMPQGRTVQGASQPSDYRVDSDYQTKLYLVGTSSATKTGTMFSSNASGNAKNLTVKNLYIDGQRNGIESTVMSFTAATKTISVTSNDLRNRGFSAGDSIVITGSTSNNGTYTVVSVAYQAIVVAETLVNESAGATVRLQKSGSNGVFAGACFSFAGHNDYGSNNIAVTDCYVHNYPVQAQSINSIDGYTPTRLKTTANRNPIVASHYNDFDAVAFDKPSTAVTPVSCDWNSFGHECMKLENVNVFTDTGTRFRNYVTLANDEADIYYGLGTVTFNSSIFDDYISHTHLKRAHVTGKLTAATHPAVTLTLGAATVGATTATASAAVFTDTATDAGRGIFYSTLGFTGYAVVNTVTDTTHANVTVVNAFSSASLASGAWTYAWSNNSGTGAVTYSGCTFNEYAVAFAGVVDSNLYGTLTFTNNTFSGENSACFPTAVTLTKSGNTGMGTRLAVWVLNEEDQSKSNVGGIAASLGNVYAVTAVAKSVGAKRQLTQLLADLSNSIYSNWGFTTNGVKVIVADATYTAGTLSGMRGVNTPAANIAIEITSESGNPYSCIMDGTGQSSQGWLGFTNANTSKITVHGFTVQNFSGGSSTRPITQNQASSAVEYYDMIFKNNSTTNGGGAVRGQSYLYSYGHDCVFDTNSVSSSSGGAVLLDGAAANAISIMKSCLFKGNSTANNIGGAVRTGGAAASNHYVIGCEFRGNTTGGSTGALASSTSTSGCNLHLYNNSFLGNVAGSGAAGADISLTLGNAGVTANLYNNICRSETTAVSKTGVGVINYGWNNYNAISVASGTNNNLGGNITTDPLYVSSTDLTISNSSPCVGTGKWIAGAAYINGQPVDEVVDMGAYRKATVQPTSGRVLATGRTAASARTAATTRTAATARTASKTYYTFTY